MGGDPYFASTALLLPMTASFSDISPSPKSVSVYGNAAISSAQSKWGSSSGFFDGSGDYLEIPDHVAFRPEYNSFTIEMWVRPAAIGSAMTLFAKRNTNDSINYRLYITASGMLEFASNNPATITTSAPLIAGQWQHVAISKVYGPQDRYGPYTLGRARLFVNGTPLAEADTAGYQYINGDAECSIGRGSATIPDYFSGHIQDVRFTTGIARYQGHFIPPSMPFPDALDLSCTASIIESPLTCAPAAIAGPPIARLLQDAITWDAVDGGNATVSGIVTLNGVPGARKVRLHTLNNGRLIRETWSDPVTGAYRFERLRDQPYYVWSEDYMRVYDPVSHLVTNQVT